ncbi:type II and III secretion system protein family protein [Marinobacterium sediminicola]|uniref:Pilus assembly protein CpaC n=1 Tax=Marinobacterium sediminicola TaxID=518898 RepID=A0ABY1RZN8_9GAMM|nr:type II and III secretion system protein family protein [Marinobacterium sediminicola]ULG69961.1 type II and III secretion system protein family protein [Marinobacterium sediminicola]SMR74411.1 pilus assembly protein CpaC [Marinobacterium sediminicola]
MAKQQERHAVVVNRDSDYWFEGILPAFLLIVMLILMVGEAKAATIEAGADSMVERLTVPLYKSKVVQLNGPVHKVSIGNEEIADILVMRSQQIYVLGKGIGTTNVLLWDKRNRLTASIDVEVTPDVNSLKAKLYEMAPSENIRVNSSQGSILLSGEVSNIGTMDMAVRLADSFLQKPSGEGASQMGEVVNLLKVGGSQQVMLKVTVAEMSRDVTKRMGLNFNLLDISDGNWSVGASSVGGSVGSGFGFDAIDFSDAIPSVTQHGFLARYLDSNLLFSVALDAAKENGSARILAEPTLTTLTGQEAEFLSGGEFPVPVPDDDGITIEFKEYGVGLKFLPVVLDSGTINLSLNVAVTDFAATGAVQSSVGDSGTYLIPALTKRSARSTVELGDGQTIGIAGLISESTREAVNKFPGLGDVPVLGHLFRSSQFESGETELVILVTPTLAQPFKNEGIPLPGDGFVEPSDAEFYLLGRTRGSRSWSTSMASNDAGAAASDGNVSDATENSGNGPASGMAVDNDVRVYPVTDGSESTFGHSIQ